MRIVSINVGKPREIVWRGETIRTSIFKSSVSGSVAVRSLNMDGDEQSDLSVHGGMDKAVYAYPAEHYEYWKEILDDAELAWGAFGENLTTEGLNEEDLQIGDRLLIGTAEFMITQPRMPCVKLSARFGRPDMVKLFQQSGRNGFYLAVTREGIITSGDSIDVTATDNASLSVMDIVQLYSSREIDSMTLQKATTIAALPQDWRAFFRERLARNN